VQVLGIGPAGKQVGPGAGFGSYWEARTSQPWQGLRGEELKAVALRGLGMLEVADGFFDRCSG